MSTPRVFLGIPYPETGGNHPEWPEDTNDWYCTGRSIYVSAKTEEDFQEFYKRAETLAATISKEKP